MNYVIRPFGPGDYEPLAALFSVVMDRAVSAESLRHNDETRDPRYLHRCWVACAGEQVVGCGLFEHIPGQFHPRKFEVDALVHPDWRRQGIGTALSEQVMAGLAAYDPIALTTGTKETWTDAVRFLAKHGFEEVLRNWESELDLVAFDPSAYASVVSMAQARGYTFASYASLRDLPDFDRRLYELIREVRMDIPSADVRTDIPFEVHMKSLHSPHFFPECYYVALYEGELVGLSTIKKSDEEGRLNVGVTAVRRAHRGQGVAKALKVCALTAAKGFGYKSAVTWNATHNHGMLAINGWLGFVRKPAWIVYKRTLCEEGSR